MAEISAKRVGYLRLVPKTQGSARAASGPIKSMWRKFHADGLVYASATTVPVFWITSRGVQAIKEFDENLSEPCRAVLNAVKAGQSGIASMKGLATCVDAGLVRFVDSASRYELTEDGLRLADPIGEEGYFTKSGAKVRIIDVRVDEDGVGNLVGRRTDGESKGKDMCVPRDTFVREADWPAYCEG